MTTQDIFDLIIKWDQEREPEDLFDQFSLEIDNYDALNEAQQMLIESGSKVRVLTNEKNIIVEIGYKAAK